MYIVMLMLMVFVMMRLGGALYLLQRAALYFHQVGNGFQVHRGIFADRGVRAATRFDAPHALGRQCPLP
jgi:hypothetical protein